MHLAILQTNIPGRNDEFHVESSEERMELSDTASNDLYDYGHKQNKIEVNDCITSPNVYILWALSLIS